MTGTSPADIRQTIGPQTPRREDKVRRLARVLDVAGAVLILGLTWVTYSAVVDGGFIWDDDSYVSENKLITEPGGLPRIWFSTDSPQYYPLVFTTFRIEHLLWGLDPTGYHVVNILLHAASALLLWRLLARLGVPAAWVIGAVFAVHPVHVESVAWITERKNVLSGFFYLAAAAAYLRFEEAVEHRGARRTGWWYAAALVLFLGALLSKTVTCTLPAALLLLRYLRGRRIGVTDFARLAPMAAIGLAMAGVTVWYEQHRVLAVGEHFDLTLAERVLIAGRALGFYAGKLLWPEQLAFVYSKWSVDPSDSTQWLWPVGALALGAGLWAGRRLVGRGPLVAYLFFVVTLSPALGFFNVYPMRYSYVADHFQYLASIGVIAGVVGCLATLGAILPGRWVRLGLTFAGVPVVLVLLSIRAQAQGEMYADTETLWRKSLEQEPEAAMPHYNLGRLLRLKAAKVQDAALLEEAVVHLREAIRLAPNEAGPYDLLGETLTLRKRLAEGLEMFRKAVEIDPTYVNARRNLGIALVRTGKVDEAIEHFRAVIEIAPQHPFIRFNLADALQRAKRLEEAAEAFREAVAVHPDAGGYRRLAGVLHALGKPQSEVEDLLREAERLERAGSSEPTGGSDQP